MTPHPLAHLFRDGVVPPSYVRFYETDPRPAYFAARKYGRARLSHTAMSWPAEVQLPPTTRTRRRRALLSPLGIGHLAGDMLARRANATSPWQRAPRLLRSGDAPRLLAHLRERSPLPP